MSNQPNVPESEPPGRWAVAVVLLRQRRAGVVGLNVRHAVWPGGSKDEAVGHATQEALNASPGWQLHLVSAVEVER